MEIYDHHNAKLMFYWWYRSSLEQNIFLAAAGCIHTLLCLLVLPFRIRMDWNYAWWLSRWQRPSLEQFFSYAAASCLYFIVVCLHISQPFLIGMNWKLTWWLFKWYRPSLKQNKNFSCCYTKQPISSKSSKTIKLIK